MEKPQPFGWGFLLLTKHFDETYRNVMMAPDMAELKKEAERVRLGIQDYCGSDERMRAMTYEEKLELLAVSRYA